MASLLTGTTIAGNIALHAGNYTSYSPSLTGSGASGNWSINSANVTISNLATQQVSISLAAGAWYTIAANDSNRASAKFTVTDTSSGLHQAVHFYATAHYGTDTGAKITVVSNTYYSGPPVSAIRIMRGSTYEGAMVQIYAAYACNLVVSIYDNQQSAGWVIKSGVVSTTNPGTVSNFAGLTTNAAQVDLNSGKSFSVSDDIYVGVGTTQYRVLHTNSTLTAGNLSGTIPSAVLGNSAHFIGTTSIALNRASASQTLTGVSIDGNSGSVTNGVYTTGDQSIGGTKTFTRINFGATGATPYSSAAGEGTGNGITFGGDEAGPGYRIFTGMENIGGNYSKLTLNWHTGIRIGAYVNYGGVRFYNNAVGATNPVPSKIFSVGEGDDNVRVYNELIVSGVGTSAYNILKYGGIRSGDWQSFTNLTGQINVIQVNNITNGSHTNYPTGVYGYGGVLSWKTSNHSFQLYAAHTGDLAYKTQWDNDNYSGWRRILDSSSYPYAANMNQYVRTTDVPTFSGVYTTQIGINDSGMDCYINITDSNPSFNYETYGGEFYFYGDKDRPSSLLYVGGIDVSRTIIANAISSRDYTRQLFPSGGYFYAGGAQTGALKIKLPANTKSVYPMLSFTCHIYNYSTGTSRTFKIGGHFSNTSWYNPFAYCLSESGTNLNVRWGYEGTSICVWIGETNSGWSYPCVFITDFQNGYSAIDGIWMNGWTLSLVTAFDTVTNGPTAAGFFWNQNNDGAGSGLDADLLDGYSSATANTANTIVLRDGSGNFSAGTITAALNGNASTVTNGIYTTSYYTGTPLGKRRYRIHSSDGTSLNSSISSLECGFTYGGSGEPTGPFIAFGGLGGSIDYSCQLVGAYSGGNDFKIRTRNDDTAAWNAWRTILTDGNYTDYTVTKTGGGASGVWAISVNGGSAYAPEVSLTGLGTSTVNVNNPRTAVYRNENGTGAALAYAPVLHLGGGDTMWQIQGTYGSSGNGTLYFRQGYNGSWGTWLTMLSSANYNSYSPTLTGTGASGSWGINITGSSASCTGNAATATTTDNINGRAFYNRDSGNVLGQDSYTNNGIGYVNGVSLFGQSDGGIFTSAYSTSWIHQIYGDFRTGQIAIRGKNNGTWQSWRTVLDSSNSSFAYAMNQGVGTSNSPSFTGLTVTNTISGSVNGNAATATLATKASTLSQGGGNGTAMTFNWAGQSGQPTWLWGSNDGTNIYVWNPSNFNVNSAATLTTARNINGTSFNGSAAITTASWGTARTLTVGSTGKSVDGSANVSWSLSEIGIDARIRAWCHFDGTPPSATTLNANFNVSSVTKNGTGDYTVNFTSAIGNTTYVVAGTAQLDAPSPGQSNYNVFVAVPRRSGAQASGSCRVVSEYPAGVALYDSVIFRVAFIAA